MLKIYNTEKRKKEEISLKEGSKFLKMYTCGPTVYNYAHIGNLRTYVFEDLLRRTIKLTGIPLKHVMNLTDVEDKTIQGAIQKKMPLNEYTQIYKDAFFQDLNTLEIESAEIYSNATDYIPQMIQMIEVLIEKGIAYQGKDGGVYYSIKKFPLYGRLSHLETKDLKEGASERISDDEYDKESASDFVLWKAYDPSRDGQIYWESPFGRGRPGWHIECSAMARHLLGDTIDIHVGGVDNIFPHHENEIAQSEGCTGKKFVRYWMHSEHLIVDGKKMSKSSGNFYTLRDLLKKGYTGLEVRYLLIGTHYRTQLNFTLEGLKGARQAIARWSAFIHRLRHANGKGDIKELIEQTFLNFKKALCDDLNISVAFAVLFNFLKAVNIHIDKGELSEEGAQEGLEFLEKVNDVVGIFPLDLDSTCIPKTIQIALEKRDQARKKRDWIEADKHRDYIHSEGYIIEDAPTGSIAKKA